MIGRSLRSSFTWLTGTVACIGAAALVALVVLTAILSQVTAELSTALESIQVAKETRVQLLTHSEAYSPAAKAAAAAALLSAVDEAGALVQSSDERSLYLELRRATDAYLRPGAGDAELTAALTAAHRIAFQNVEHGRGVRLRAMQLDRLAKLVGATVGLLLLGGMVGFSIWLRRGPFRYIQALASSMTRFSAGDRDARAPEKGPVEVVEMARTFNASADALAGARQRQSEYVATAIHDLRTPLAAIQLAVGYFDPDRPLPPAQRVRELVDLIGRQLQRINAAMGDVLNATWIEGGEMQLRKTEFDLRSVVSASTEQFRSLAPEHRLELVMPSRPVQICGDRTRLEQVVNNLLSNAVKYSPLGGRVCVELEGTATEVTLSVSDEGPGIPAQDRERIFETFRRRSFSHEEAPGTSLGLWVSRRIVEAHGGQLELVNAGQQGGTFRVTLPAEVQTPTVTSLPEARTRG